MPPIGAMPICFADIDNDDDFDLFLCYGNYNKLTYYVNEGTSQNPNMQFVTNEFFGNDVELLSPSGIDFVDIDNDGDGDFIFSGIRAGMMFFRNISGDSTGVNNSRWRQNPAQVVLSAYPNPFNSSTVISFDLQTASLVKLAVYDIMGREVKTLVAGDWGLGKHQVVWDASNQASGIYFIRLQSESMFKSQKVMLLK